MSNATRRTFLRRVLLADGAISGAAGLLMLLAAGPLEAALGVPAVLLRYAGVALVPFSLGVLSLARRGDVPRGAVWAVIALNLGWVAASLLLAFSGRIAPSLPGHVFILGQAFAVAVFAEMQYVGLRKAAAA
jgi:hypothetical protein